MPTPSSEQLDYILRIEDTSTARINSFQEKVPWFQQRLQEWYAQHGRDFPWRENSRTDYEIVVAEVLLWRTRAENVAKLYPGFLNRFPNWDMLAKASEEELRSFLRPIGYVERAPVLIALATMVKEEQISSLTRDELQRLPGIGQYIASAVLTICQEKREPLLDVNMARVLERFFGSRKLADIRFDPYLQQLSRAVMPGEEVTKFNWGILDFAALVCKSGSPLCETCPLRLYCTYANSASATSSV